MDFPNTPIATSTVSRKRTKKPPPQPAEIWIGSSQIDSVIYSLARMREGVVKPNPGKASIQSVDLISDC